MTKRILTIALCALLMMPAAAQTMLLHPWQGKKVAYFGDSITDPRNSASKNKYWSFLQQWLGITPFVYGVSGRQWNDIARQANKLKEEHGDDFDAIIIFMGTNDYNKGVPLGEWYTEKKEQVEYAIGSPKKWDTRLRRYPAMDKETYRGRINIAMDTLKRMFPTKQIVILTPIHRAGFYRSETNWQPTEDYQNRCGEYLSAYVEATKETADVWAVPVIDLSALSGLYPLHDTHAQYFKDAATDRLHPNDAGHLRMARTLMYQLLTLPCTFDYYTPTSRRVNVKMGSRNNLSLRPGRYSLRSASPEFFHTDEARRIGDQVIAYQRNTGGWPKNIDMAAKLSKEEMAAVKKEKSKTDDSTIDNNATTMQMTYLAQLYAATGEAKYRDSFRRGLDYILSGQYANGGWPQFWPNPQGYQKHITYNDNAIANTLIIIQQMLKGEAPYNGDIVEKRQKARLTEAFNRGIDCILKTQIIVDGKPTVWCQQHDRETFQPAKARSYELPSFCSAESSGLVRLLMSLPQPNDDVKRAIHGAMQWFEKNKITGMRYNRFGFDTPDGKAYLVPDSTATPFWARFYDLEECQPFFCDRDGVPQRSLSDIGKERREGYAWYTDNPTELYKEYKKWSAKHDPKK